jgi:hypothetical protein
MPPCAAWWKLVFACDKYTGHSMPLAGVNVAKWMRSAVWAEARETDCEGLAPVTRRVPDELLPQTVREVTPMVTLERKASRTRELLLFQKDLWFAVGKSRYKAAVLDGNMAGEKFICFYPLRGDGKAPLTVVRGTRWLHVALNFRMDTVSAFEVPPTPIRDNYAFMRSGERLYHPAMVGAVQHAFSLFGDAEVDFYADDSRVEPKSIVWMRLRMPREAVEGHPLTEVVRAFWDGDGPGPRESERLNVCGGRAWHEPCVNMVVCAYGCYGALFIERTPMASMLYVTVPVLVGEVRRLSCLFVLLLLLLRL